MLFRQPPAAEAAAVVAVSWVNTNYNKRDRHRLRAVPLLQLLIATMKRQRRHTDEIESSSGSSRPISTG
jgi:hypothetical protein